jgi:hypothetical protein
MKAKHSLRREARGSIADESGDKVANDASPQAKNDIVRPSEDQIAALAYGFWLERGCPEGCPEEDWFRAEREISRATKKDSVAGASSRL